MNTEVKKGALFVKEVLSRITGDDKEALANKIARKSISAVSGQISALESKEIDDEAALEDANEALANAIYPTAQFTDAKAYCNAIARAQESADQAEMKLDDTKASLVFFKELLEKF